MVQNENVFRSKTFEYLSGHGNINVLIAQKRFRGGKLFKPTQKMQKMEWTHVSCRRARDHHY